MGIDQVNVAVAQMDEVTQQDEALVEQASAPAQALAEQPETLRRAVAVLQVERAARSKLARREALSHSKCVAAGPTAAYQFRLLGRRFLASVLRCIAMPASFSQLKGRSGRYREQLGPSALPLPNADTAHAL